MADQQSYDIKHKMAFDAIGFAAQLLTPQAGILETLVSTEIQMHSYLHITDPTLYMRAMNSKGLDQQVRLAKAALAFVREVQAVKVEIVEATNG